MSDIYCNIHGMDKNCSAGCSAHYSNWYCPECEKNKTAYTDWLEKSRDTRAEAAFNAGVAVGMKRAAEIAHEKDYGLVELATRRKLETK